MRRIALNVIYVLASVVAHGQQFSAYKPLNAPEAANVQDVAAGDLDNDGDADIVIGSYKGWVTAYFNQGDGSFDTGVRLAEGMERVYQVLLVDLDLDGDLDVTYASWGTPDAGWCENLGGGSFASPLTLVHELYAHTACSMSWADVDEDGYPDLFLTSYIHGLVSWYRNNGDRTVGPRATIVDCPYAWVCATADMDGDGDVDVVVAGDGISWRDSQNDQFNGAVPPYGFDIGSGQNDLRGLALQDDGDGFPDVYVADQLNDRILRYSNNGTGNYSLLGTMTVYASNVPGVEALRSLDLNGDGIEEIVAACSEDHTIRFGSGSVLVSGVMGASGMAVADFNGDGLQDLVAAAANSSQVHVFEGDGTFQFTLAETLNEVAGNVPELVIVDVDGDGLNDIVESFTGAATLGWKRNLGSEQFGPVQIIDEGVFGAQRVLMRDLDNDGDPDLIVPAYPDSLVWYRNESGVLSTPTLITDAFGPMHAFDTGDFDGDGDQDLAVAQSGSGNYVWWYANSGTGVFSAPVVVAVDQTNVRRLICADVNGDGADEIIYFREYAQGTMICMNDGTGSFAAPAVLDGSLIIPLELRSADLNADGWPDLVIDRQSSAAPLICLLGNGDGTFTASDTAGLGDGVLYGSLDIADMDGDGDLDLVAAATNLSYLYKWFANDGTGQFPESYRIDTMYTATGWAVGDLDGDGDPDLLTVHAEQLRWYENFIGSPYSASGRIYYDVDADLEWSDGDIGLPGTGVHCDPSASVPYSGGDGSYRFGAEPQSYTLSAPSPHPWWTLATGPGTYEVTLSESDPEADGLDFGFVPVFDTLVVSVASTAAPLRCAQPYHRWLDLVNTGTVAAVVELDYVAENTETILSADPPADLVIGNIHRWNFTLPVLGTQHITLLAETNIITTPERKDSVHASMTAPGIIYNLALTHLRNVLCAFDPNDKQVEPVGFGEFGAIDIDTERLTYTVRFQNTGTDTAFTVMVRDRLDARLDRSSIQVLGTSHTLTALNIEEDGEAVFLFDNILLPDSNVNEPASHGYVVFTIDVLPGAPDGTSIPNSVEIYFDGNEPVITNTVLNTLVDCSLFDATITSLDGSMLLASPGERYQWFLNGEPLQGDTLQELLMPAEGIYTVNVVSAYGCEAISGPFEAIGLSIAEEDGLRMVILPNPLSDASRMVFSRILPRNAVGTVVNTSGAVVRHIPLGAIREYDLERGDLAPGIYLLRVDSGSRQLVARRFIVH
jgi:hypothetical protein